MCLVPSLNVGFNVRRRAPHDQGTPGNMCWALEAKEQNHRPFSNSGVNAMWKSEPAFALRYSTSVEKYPEFRYLGV